ncbi:MAG TPA: metallophosphoesterase [Edaphobacter sp.]
MHLGRFFLLSTLFTCSFLYSEDAANKPKTAGPEDLPNSSLISQPGPSFRVAQTELGKDVKVIVYGDQRFTDPANTKVTNPKVRRLLVQKIAEEHPNAVLMDGDVPYSGDVVNDYEVYKTETKIWRDEHLGVYPALGNHEFHGDPQQALEHWWSAFPELRDRRWYSVELGKSIYTIALDSDTYLTKGSQQLNWLNEQLLNLPKTTLFVFINLHHPPVADFQNRINVSHNPRPNEIALRDELEALAPRIKARIIVSAGHIHNYERFSQGGVTFLVSGGGAASPVEVERTPDDLYQDNAFPNYHFVEFSLKGKTLEGRMFRLADPNADNPSWELKDSFSIEAK